MTIVTPSLNGIEYLDACIESVRSQQTRQITVEHLLVDGGSTDGTPEFAASQGCIVMTRDEVSLYAAINKGSFAAKGTLLGALACDDVMLPGALATVVEHYERTGRRWLMGGYRWFTPGGSHVDVHLPPPWMTSKWYASLPWSCIPHCASFFRRDLFDEMGGYNPDFRFAGDFEFFARLLARNELCARIHQSLYGWRRHERNLSKDMNSGILGEIALVQDQYAPSNRWQRFFYKWALRSYLNARTPQWFLLKRRDDQPIRLASQVAGPS